MAITAPWGPGTHSCPDPGPRKAPLSRNKDTRVTFLYLCPRDAHSVLKEQGGEEHSPAGEEAPAEGPQQDPGHEGGLAPGLQALAVTHQAPLEEKEGPTTRLRAHGLDLRGQGGRGRPRAGVPRPEHTHHGVPRSLGPGNRHGRGVLVVGLHAPPTASSVA